MSVNKKIVVIFICLLIIIFAFLFVLFYKRSFSVIFAGDALINYRVLADAYDEESDNFYFDNMLLYLDDYINKFDLAFYNQESPISGDEMGYYGIYCLNSPSSFATSMIKLGFNVINLANNHSLDGQYNIVNNQLSCYNNIDKSVNNSLTFWKSQKNIQVIGVHKKGQYLEPKIKIINGIKYAFLSYTDTTNAAYKKIDYQDEYVNIYSEELVKQEGEFLRDKVDIIFVSMHWGRELLSIPTLEQKKQAKYLASLGVDVIVGHHSHVVEPIEWIDNTLVIYSLGNFITGSYDDGSFRKYVGQLVSFNVEKNFFGDVAITNLSSELTYNYFDQNFENIKVIPFSRVDENILSNYKEIFERYYKIVTLYDKSIYVKGIK